MIVLEKGGYHKDFGRGKKNESMLATAIQRQHFAPDIKRELGYEQSLTFLMPAHRVSSRKAIFSHASSLTGLAVKNVRAQVVCW